MTSEQIRVLERRLHDSYEGTIGGRMALNEIPRWCWRLLGERERLLKAVAALATVTDGRGACTSPQCLRSYQALIAPHAAAKAAIAYAEESAPFAELHSP